MARQGGGRSFPYGPPEYDWSNKAYVKSALERQNKERRRKPVYFSEWRNFGNYIKRNSQVRKALFREANKILSDLKGQLRSNKQLGSKSAELAERLYTVYERNGGYYRDRPFIHIAERSVIRKVGGRDQAVREFGLVDFRSSHSDSSWSELMSDKAEWEGRFGKGTWPGTGQYKDTPSIRDEVVKRYHQRNPDSVRYGRL